MEKVIELLGDILPDFTEDELKKLKLMVEEELGEKDSEWIDMLVQNQLNKEKSE